jgi:hypothetical protein
MSEPDDQHARKTGYGCWIFLAVVVVALAASWFAIRLILSGWKT